MKKEEKAILGAWAAAIGTIMSAVASTSKTKIGSELNRALDLWGNVLQGTGSALAADSEEEITLNKISNEIQAIGNSTVVTGIIIDFADETKEKLTITGNWLQALGSATSFGVGLTESQSKGKIISLNGNLLQFIGNSLQAVSGVSELKEMEGEKSEVKNDSQRLDAIGSWIQAVGSVLSLLAVYITADVKGKSEKNKRNDQFFLKYY